MVATATPNIAPELQTYSGRTRFIRHRRMCFQKQTQQMRERQENKIEDESYINCKVQKSM